MGLPPGAAWFSLSELPGTYLLVNIFHELCSSCLRLAPHYDRVFHEFRDGPAADGRIKFIALAADASPRTAAGFRKRNLLGYPVFADERRTVFKSLGEPVLPALYLLRKTPQGPWILAGHLTAFEGDAAELKAWISKTVPR